jgi:hypothetical protein
VTLHGPQTKDLGLETILLICAAIAALFVVVSYVAVMPYLLATLDSKPMPAWLASLAGAPSAGKGVAGAASSTFDAERKRSKFQGVHLMLLGLFYRDPHLSR